MSACRVKICFLFQKKKKADQVAVICRNGKGKKKRNMHMTNSTNQEKEKLTNIAKKKNQKIKT